MTFTATGATDINAPNASNDKRVITFKAADGESLTFGNVLAGVTYSVQEAQASGYSQHWEARANGVNTTDQNELLVGEYPNVGDMTNSYTDVIPTGLVLDNLPFILMGLVAVGALIAYGAAKRKLEH